MTMRLLTLFLGLAMSAFSPDGFAKRVAPKPVAAVIVNGVRYSAPAEFMGYVIATDAYTQKELWRKLIYSIDTDPALEPDVQEVFVTSLALHGAQLLITNERGENYLLDLATRSVTRLP